ncbi:MAG TPA: efflux RND transporter periplasmic adaptor subunit [Vicinamibacteria bacterium]|nr:efflux RND transporter periplasmic adaptor subunit [Vicinamibacteria bacterium]
MSSGTVAAERAARVLSRLRERIAEGAQWTLHTARLALRRETWTAEGLRGALEGARRRPMAATFALALAAGLVALLISLALGLGSPPGVLTSEVREGPFVVTIVEAGTLQALRSVTYASAIQSNQAKIVALAPEGTLVQKGDLLILFDAAPFEEEIRRSQAALGQAEADLEKARQDVKLQAIQNLEELASSRQKVERSDLELKDVTEGKGKLKEEETVAAVANAERELSKARSAYDDLKPLLAEGFITKVELDRAEQAVAKATEELALAQRRRDSLLNYGRPLELSQARSDALLTKESLRQLESAAAFRVEQKKAAVASAESRIQESAAKLALARAQLARTEVRADVPGIVVYRNVFFGSEQRKPQVGDQVWANQPLLILPDISRMVVETTIRETDIHKVEKNQNVAVRVEAYPALKLTGKVTLVGTLAQEEKDRRGAKFFGVTVELNEADPRLRPGMTAQVEIQVEERQKALFVPVGAVFERDGRHVCYVAAGRRAREREVVLGPSNQDHVVVEKGLERGERVCLRDPGAPASDFGALAAP